MLSPVPLHELRRGEVAQVSGIVDGVAPTLEAAVMRARLRDLGFVGGARCEIVARMWLGGDPLVVRVGGSTFALRRVEAASILVQRIAVQPAGHASFSTNASALA